MARNLELKVRCDEDTFTAVQKRALLAGSGPFIPLRQVDTYVQAPYGRLKLRTTESEDGGSTAELIAYQRPDDSDSRWSDYHRVPLGPECVAGIETALVATCGVKAIVDKRREVAILGRTRIHLDRVVELGSFIELETVAGPNDDDANLAREHVEVIGILQLGGLERVSGSYGELIECVAGSTQSRKGSSR
jgi:adenylate cyclase class IV